MVSFPADNLIDDLKPDVDELRGIPHELGARRFSVSIVRLTYPGGNAFSGAEPVTEVLTEITNQAGEANPKVTWTQKDLVARTMYPDAELQIGPLTPEYDGGGTSFETLTQITTATKGDEIFFIVDGEGLVNQRFEMVGIDATRALGTMIFLKRIST